jgi:hypothetical protein
MFEQSTRTLRDREIFRASHLRELKNLLTLARELTGDFFHLGNEEAGSVPYEVCTLNHLEEQEIRSDGILADIARYQYIEPRFGRKKDLYRVNLQDHNILFRLRQEPEKLKFSPLMLYILTHEIIHVIRFVKFIAPFYKIPHQRIEEETKVHALTQRLLSIVPLPGMDEVLRRFGSKE